MTDWTTPRTWISEVLTSTLLNTHLRDNLNHLYEKSIPVLIPGLQGHAGVAGLGGAGTSEEWGTTTPGLTWNNTPATVDSNTTILNHLYIANAADATERLGTKSWAPAGAFDARLGGVIIGSNASVAAVSPSVGLHIGDSGNSNRALVLVNYTCSTGALVIQAFTYASSTYTSRGTAITAFGGSPLYLRITRDGSNNVSFYWSPNGNIWNFIATQAFTFTVANIGLRVVGHASAAFQCAVDWLRTDV